MLDTKILFLKLLRVFQPDNILDIGSRDAREALTFRDCLPGSSIYAFEANPALFARIQADQNVARAHIHAVNKAASNETGTIRFQISDGDYDNTTRDDLAGTSSIKERPGFAYKASIDVESTTLDTYFQDTPGHFALWIDVEGATFEVIEGALNLLPRV
ncbi:MAG: FkbM family methyltransferase, partial [Pseudomonadales bacterium]|nr:FkbM family methyltransferase [Pseudomonadales bacterium]